MRALIYCDGSCYFNPGPMSVGVSVRNDQNVEIYAHSQFVGTGTNNEAEYHAVLISLQCALEMGYDEVTIHTDSELIARHLTGEYECRQANLLPLLYQVRARSRQFKDCRVVEVKFPSDKKRAHDLAKIIWQLPEGKAAIAERERKTTYRARADRPAGTAVFPEDRN